ncbi:NUDIX domain-containing protein [Mycoplasma enhydrae]|uniref:bis(5'-nucleosyl)-tetraphosphatase n=1 Tax=Mycoplasma enhydrae TaxID=2499220 RepID=UPI00197BF664|nr:NUDIX domain-containing protein [Mycoplasma enhydrae]MBN4089275.1 NUDIX domain-containing protein [Mycoplasma enhydrae]MCV3733565.1 NUDIX domain-containing protein [Mycoplasma enhydrae]MCV3753459.1 NUDIX domain-containing protein [Mycoplasma enhydrae]
MRYEKSCGLIVLKNIESKLYVLLVQQKAGHWSFPKGHVEKDETEIETAIRETKEETNIDVEILDGFRETSQYSPFKGTSKKVVFFLAKPKSFDLKNQIEEIDVVEWVNVEEALVNRIIHDNNREILEKAINHYINHYWNYKK